MGDLESLVSHWLAFEIGKGMAETQQQKDYNKRLDILKSFKIILPEQFFLKNINMQAIYREGILAHLHGLPNATVPLLMKTLEIALRKKYEEIEKKKCKLDFANLIDWGERYYPKDKQLIQAFRGLRNILHEDELLNEGNSIDTIRLVSKILNALYPFFTIELSASCPTCKSTRLYEFQTHMCFLGNQTQLSCLTCRRGFAFSIYP